jgi:hypothetical protein
MFSPNRWSKLFHVSEFEIREPDGPLPIRIQKWRFMHGCRFSNIFIQASLLAPELTWDRQRRHARLILSVLLYQVGQFLGSFQRLGQKPVVIRSQSSIVKTLMEQSLFSSRCVQPTTWGMTTVFSDSVDPVWTGSASNVGKPIKGGGTHTVLGRWDGRQWVIAG